MTDFVKIVDANKADRMLRLVNLIIDIIVYFIFTIVIGFIFGFAGVLLGFDMSFLGELEEDSLLSRVIGVILMIIYYTLIETVTKGRSVGKFITGTMVVNENGGKPDMTIYLKRSLLRLIPFETFSFFGENGWHDKISKTRVVNKTAYEEQVRVATQLPEIGSKDY